MKLFKTLLAVALCCSAFVLAGENTGVKAPPAPSRNAAPSAEFPLLPNDFAGWHASATLSASSDPATADPVNATLLKEYGFTDFASAVYARDTGAILTIKAARFIDASGSYGAFTYYELPQMLSETIKDQGASLNQRVLFYRGNILVDAVFSGLTAMSTAELRELSDALPPPPGNAGNAPSLPLYLPRQSFVKGSMKYVLGPIGLEKIGLEKTATTLPAQFIDFAKSAQVVTGQYETSAGKATLTLIEYPTPQIAADELRQLDAAKQTSPSNGGSASGEAIVSGATVYDKRTGPIVAAVTGAVSPSEAKSLLASVNYEANVTWNENTYLTRKNNVANLLVNVIILCAILGAMAVVAGVAFGGVRVLLQRLYPGVIFRKSGDEVISLNLEGEVAGGAPVSSSNRTIER